MMRITKTKFYGFTRIVISLVLIGISLNAAVGQTIKTPEERVEGFYRWYLTSIITGPDTDKAVMISHLSKRFGRWLYSKAGESRDYDPFTNGQDFNNAWADNIRIGKLTTKGATATLNIILAGAPDDNWDMPLTVSLVKEGGAWKIDRVRGTKTTR
jgi:Protein of unknown function (DUF3828)